MSNQPSARRDWFAVERRVFDDEMFVGDEFSRRDAWLWLIANAARRDHELPTLALRVRLSTLSLSGDAARHTRGRLHRLLRSPEQA